MSSHRSNRKVSKNGLYKLPFGWRRGLIVPLVGDEPSFDAITDWIIQSRLRHAKQETDEDYQVTQVFK